MKIGRLFKLLRRIFFYMTISCAVSAFATTQNTVLFTDFEHTNPVNKPYDFSDSSQAKLQWGGKNKKDFSCSLSLKTGSQRKFLVWSSKIKEHKQLQANSNWAQWSVVIPSKEAKQLSGIQYEISTEKPVTLSATVYCGIPENKQYYYGKKTGAKRYDLKPGKNTIDVLWEKFPGIAEMNKTANGVSLSTGNIPFSFKITRINFIFKNSEKATEYLEKQAALRNKINETSIPLTFSRRTPVARPYDELLMGTRMRLFGGKQKADIVNSLIPFHEDNLDGITWKVSTKSGNKIDGGSWAVWRIRIPDDTSKYLKGIKFDVESPEEEEINVRVYCGVSEKSPFKHEKAERGSKKIFLKPGDNTFTVSWEEFPAALKSKKVINGIQFGISSMPLTMKVKRISYLFKNKAAVEQSNKEKEQYIYERLKVMLGWMSKRGVDISGLLDRKPVLEVEKLAWMGVDLLALREQIDVWSRLMNKNGITNNAAQLNKTWVQVYAVLKKGNVTEANAAVKNLRKQVDQLVDTGIAKIPVEKRKFYYDEKDRRFHRPDGRPFRVFAPHFFRAMYSAGTQLPEMLWRPWDLRYLAGMGFNGLRMQIKWHVLEPEQGKFSQAYFDMLKDIIKEAERYGIAVDIDFHWGWPEWFRKGKPGYESLPGANKANLYHWPEPVFAAWDRIGGELGVLPNVVAFEVPGNETPIGNDKEGIKSYPYLVYMWNQWLKETYKTRDNLKEAWKSSSKVSKRYELKDTEDFNKGTVVPLGWQGDPSPETAYAYNPRVYDHLRWTAWMQTYFSSEIMKILRKHRPGAIGMMQRTIGDKWDKSPVPLNYMFIQSCVGPGTIAGTHYQMGSIQAMAAATQSLASFDSEQQMENNSGAVEKQVEIGLGFCPFAFHKHGGGGMLLVDDEWYLKDSVVHLPEKADWIKSYWPKEKKGKRLALIINSKQAATKGSILLKIPGILKDKYPQYKLEVYESMRLEQHPELIAGCDRVITCSDFLSRKMLGVLTKQFKGKVLLAGRLDRDAHVKNLFQELYKRKLFVNKPKIGVYSAEICGSLDLSGMWEWSFVGKKANPMKIPDYKKLKWSRMKVPGEWGELGITGSLEYALGYAWYHRQVKIPQSWKGRDVFVKFGAIDDVDWMHFNGKFIGKTDTSFRNYWLRPRLYRIPDNIIKWGKENTIDLCVGNLFRDSGIFSPAQIFSLKTIKLKWLDGKKKSKAYPFTLTVNSPRIFLNELLPDVRVIAELQEAEKKRVAAFIKQGRFWWWIGRRNWNSRPGQLVLAEFLNSK